MMGADLERFDLEKMVKKKLVTGTRSSSLIHI